uniref:Uncharacterized protein n=1 Tax=Triticum urartu TaxID=4572 RepID=A0A8R7QD51_TRIUA
TEDYHWERRTNFLLCVAVYKIAKYKCLQIRHELYYESVASLYY